MTTNNTTVQKQNEMIINSIKEECTKIIDLREKIKEINEKLKDKYFKDLKEILNILKENGTLCFDYNEDLDLKYYDLINLKSFNDEDDTKIEIDKMLGLTEDYSKFIIYHLIDDPYEDEYKYELIKELSISEVCSDKEINKQRIIERLNVDILNKKKELENLLDKKQRELEA